MNEFFFIKQHSGLLKELILTNFRLKDQSDVLGLIWSFLNPMIMLLILFIVFKVRFAERVENYPIYLLIGIIQYTYFANATTVSMRILYSNKHLICNTIFPKEILVIGSVISVTIEFCVALAICVILAFFFGITPAVSFIMLPFVLVLQFLLILWVSLILSSLYVFVRDIDHIYQILLRVLFFITPIFYDLSFLGDSIAKHIVMMNPLTFLINFTRALILDGELFSIQSFAILFFINIGAILLAFKAFKKFEPRFAEHL